MDKITGELQDLKVYNNWAKAALVTPEGKRLTVVGSPLVGLKEGNSYQFEGYQTTHEKFGLQLDVKVASMTVDASREALGRHIKRNFKGMGEVGIKKMLNKFADNLDDLRNLLINTPHLIDFSEFTKKNVQSTDEATIESYIYRTLATRVGVMGVQDNVLRALAKHLVTDFAKHKDPVAASWNKFAENPYAYIPLIDGLGFRQADAIGMHLGMAPNDPNRMAALASEAIRNGCDGHVYLSLAEVHNFITELDPRIDATMALRAAMKKGNMIVQDGDRFYPKSHFDAETNLARILAERAVTVNEPMSRLSGIELHKKIEDAELLLRKTIPNLKLDDSQRNALVGMLTSTETVHTLTAGPGCGKTALMEILAIVTHGKKHTFCGPTGMSAKVLSSRVRSLGLSASTIHSTLVVNEGGFKHNEDDPLEVDILVADETSMDDLWLTNSLFRALPPEAHIILLGDKGQLPSVQAGDILSDLLVVQADHHQLTKTHRNAGGILTVVNQIEDGKIDCESRDDIKFWHHLPEPGSVGMDAVIAQYEHAVKNHGVKRVGLLMAKRQGKKDQPGWNTTFMNEVLRARSNPDGKPITGTTLRVGDRIIITKNQKLKQPDKTPEGEDIWEQVVNGDVGTIRSFEMAENRTSLQHLMLHLDDGRNIEYPGNKAGHLGLAYAKTVHSSQGSEFDEVLFVCTPGPASFMHRGMLKTAISRGRTMVHVIGADKVLRQVARNPIPRRNSMLVDRVIEHVRELAPVAQRNPEEIIAGMQRRQELREEAHFVAANPFVRRPRATSQDHFFDTMPDYDSMPSNMGDMPPPLDWMDDGMPVSMEDMDHAMTPTPRTPTAAVRQPPRPVPANVREAIARTLHAPTDQLFRNSVKTESAQRQGAAPQSFRTSYSHQGNQGLEANNTDEDDLFSTPLQPR